MIAMMRTSGVVLIKTSTLPDSPERLGAAQRTVQPPPNTIEGSSEMTDLGARTADQVAIEVLDGAGRAVSVEFSIRRDTVEAWTAGRCSAVFDRWLLRAWLSAPAGLYGFDDVTWARSGTGVALTIEHAFPWWILAPRDLDRLREHV
jgi:hypothetical protein